MPDSFMVGLNCFPCFLAEFATILDFTCVFASKRFETDGILLLLIPNSSIIGRGVGRSVSVKFIWKSRFI